MMWLWHHYIFGGLITILCVRGLQIPGGCKSDEYYDPSSLTCQSCPANSSMVTSEDGFGCVCDDHSVLNGISRCRPCNATEIVSADGTTCVPRRCQSTSSRVVCRKCPSDYVSVTQNFDGSPLKEVLCVKCARGYKVQGNVCVKCEACTCTKNQIVVRGICISKAYVNGRPKYEQSVLHPVVLLDILKYEYLCNQSDLRACRTLANICVKYFYSSDLPGPCSLWLQSKPGNYKALPQLTTEQTSNNKKPGEFILPHSKNTLLLAVAIYTSAGGLNFLQDNDIKIYPCSLPVNIQFGKDYLLDCSVNISTITSSQFNETLAPYINIDGNFISLPVSLRKPNGLYVQSGNWPSSNFKRYFLLHNTLSITANITNTIYLRMLLIRIRIERDRYNTGLTVRITTEAHYAIKSPLSDVVTTALKVEHVMPGAGVLRGLEIWGGVLGVLLLLYALMQWRGVVRRGGLYVSLVPLLLGAFSDTLFFSALFSTLHALAVEASMFGFTLPLSHGEEYIIKAFIYAAVSLKAIKVTWILWKQCRCDIFFLDWSEYNSPWKETSMIDKSDRWRATTVAREWSRMQASRRISPGVLITIVMIIHALLPEKPYLLQSKCYKWAIASIIWWPSFMMVLVVRWLFEQLVGSPYTKLPKICTDVGISLLVFEEEYYAHYIHGRNDDSKDVRSMAGPLATCRVACAPQLRTVYKQLSTSGLAVLGENDTKQALLSRFLAAFFERALDGLNWVASERTMFERLLNVELTAREAGNTSTLLYDEDKTPSCFAVTWWGEEWSLATFDAMIFSSMLVATEDILLGALVTITSWQILKFIRTWVGNWNLKAKTDIDIY